MPPPPLQIHPPLLNSACPWATTPEQLRALLECPSTGAVTVRTSLLQGFDHQPSRHRFTFFDPATTESSPGGTQSLPDHDGLSASSPSGPEHDMHQQYTASLNNLGYSPITLEEYLDILRDLAAEYPPHLHHKTVILSVTGSSDDVRACYDTIASRVDDIPFPLAMEVNLSCPNIPGAPPVAYDTAALSGYLAVLPRGPAIPVGIKTPPYTHAGQYESFISALRDADAGERLSFITATNTLGSCVVLGGDAQGAAEPVLPGGGAGVGGMAGPPLHPLALGNVATIRKLLGDAAAGGDANGHRLGQISIIGVGGVGDERGYRRMRAVGAAAVGLATALGREGPGVFSRIEKAIGSAW
ncbi:putative dihydroorotate dehydrogenase A-like protein [Hapsidospora chrysogenum ATCC 11550]|uniref:Putative dihydroorotate dehydrogenase A-like protein n=1 Tax=Hapsidospora chrysogenum (strain ATCC 11550 / CBS 779.69 / DSM 880 / IAM 14645 / JCM 23072 / IMI 49137) TaxID=857340 RepID=A0A086TBS6_HAPC1|nr:putative dihydroorotate dehydrogenase A-like protein [Hapsidospora chrysogenum ATCC 11550]